MSDKIQIVIMESDLQTRSAGMRRNHIAHQVMVVTPETTELGFPIVLPAAPPWNNIARDDRAEAERMATHVQRLLSQGDWCIRAKKPKWYRDNPDCWPDAPAADLDPKTEPEPNKAQP